MNNILKGQQRKANIIALINQIGPLTTEQITCLYFLGSSGPHKAQAILKRMVEAKELRRTRQSIGLCYLYHKTKKPVIKIKEFKARYNTNGVTFPAMVKTDQYYLLDITNTRHEKLKSRVKNVPDLILI